MIRILSAVILLMVLFSGCGNHKPKFTEKDLEGDWVHIRVGSLNGEAEIVGVFSLYNESFFGDTTYRVSGDTIFLLAKRQRMWMSYFKPELADSVTAKRYRQAKIHYAKGWWDTLIVTKFTGDTMIIKGWDDCYLRFKTSALARCQVKEFRMVKFTWLDGKLFSRSEFNNNWQQITITPDSTFFDINHGNRKGQFVSSTPRKIVTRLERELTYAGFTDADDTLYDCVQWFPDILEIESGDGKLSTHHIRRFDTFQIDVYNLITDYAYEAPAKFTGEFKSPNPYVVVPRDTVFLFP